MESMFVFVCLLCCLVRVRVRERCDMSICAVQGQANQMPIAIEDAFVGSTQQASKRKKKKKDKKQVQKRVLALFCLVLPCPRKEGDGRT